MYITMHSVEDINLNVTCQGLCVSQVKCIFGVSRYSTAWSVLFMVLTRKVRVIFHYSSVTSETEITVKQLGRVSTLH
jgi:hypothetical protein